jgi:hypothetical protein
LFPAKFQSIKKARLPLVAKMQTIVGSTQPQPAVTAPPVEEKPSVRDNFPANGFLWAVLGTALVLMLYFATNIF